MPLSLEGWIMDPCQPEKMDSGKYSMEMSLYNWNAKGIFIRIIYAQSQQDDLDFIEDGLHVRIEYGKVSGNGGVYVDLTDLSHIEATGADNSQRPDRTSVRPLSR